MHWIFDAIPTIFEKENDWTSWKLRLSEKLRVDAHSLVVIGSGCLGYSLNPHKNFREFNESSDIDVAVVSSYHFEVAWRFLRDVRAQIYSYPRDVQNSIVAHRDTHIFWGEVATDKILPYIQPFGPSWTKELGNFETQSPVNGRIIKVRLYRDSYSLVGYHEHGVRRLRDALHGP